VRDIGKNVAGERSGSAILNGLVWDVTERVKAEEALRREDSFRRAIIDRATEGLCVCHEIETPPYIRFTVWNVRMTEITGYTIEEINQRGWYQAVYPDPDLQRRARERMERMRVGDDLRDEEWEITARTELDVL